MKMEKGFIIKLIFLLFFAIIIHLLFFYFIPSYRCSTENGEEVRITGSDTIVCVIKTKDSGKYCINTLDCEGYCIVRNKDILEKKWIELFGNEMKIIKIEKFEKKAQIKIEGYCSKFKAGSYCGDENELFNIKNGLITKKTRSAWKMPEINCNNYFKE